MAANQITYVSAQTGAGFAPTTYVGGGTVQSGAVYSQPTTVSYQAAPAVTYANSTYTTPTTYAAPVTYAAPAAYAAPTAYAQYQAPPVTYAAPAQTPSYTPPPAVPAAPMPERIGPPPEPHSDQWWEDRKRDCKMHYENQKAMCDQELHQWLDKIEQDRVAEVRTFQEQYQEFQKKQQEADKQAREEIEQRARYDAYLEFLQKNPQAAAGPQYGAPPGQQQSSYVPPPAYPPAYPGY
mmetsp:Transcript_2308/g.5109  ORF Transcript_2308/g.5109 Transcript_2308/m.5109 type:complete len:237 (-) Transcript_2308:228-938(-)